MTSMRWIALFAVLGSSLALAQTARKGALGSTKEDEPQRPPPPAAKPDVALLRGVLWAFEPAPSEIRARAIEDLGLLGDSRALNPLAQLATDPNPAYARAAVRAVALIPHPRAEEILCNVVRHPNLPEAVKLQALDLVPFQNTDSAVRFVRRVARSTAFPQSLQQAAARLAADLPPERGLAP